MAHGKGATRYAYYTFSNTEMIINNGEPVIIYGVLLDGTAGAANHKFVDATSDRNDIFMMRVGANDTESFEIPFIAHSGFVILDSPTANHVTVFWRPTG